jgi:hypothetical protein
MSNDTFGDTLPSPLGREFAERGELIRENELE